MLVTVFFDSRSYFVSIRRASGCPWKAESIAMSPDGRYSVQFVTDVKKDSLNYVREVWKYSLDNDLSSPLFLRDLEDYINYVIMITVLCFYNSLLLVGDGLRDALDPRRYQQ